MAKILQKKVSSKDTIQKRQWTKYVSKDLSLCLMCYNSDSPLFKSYKNTSYCSEVFETNEFGKLKSTYCKNRWCGTCNRIKTARLINGYLPQLEELFQPVFVTLTLPTCKGDELRGRIETMEKTWRLLYKKSKEAKFKKIYTPLKGIRKAECTTRPNGLYHYHFHLIMDNWAQGEWIIAQWLKQFPEANRKAQDLRFADEFSFRELFKYAFKSEVKINSKINARRLDLVFNALKGKRTYGSFGGIKYVEEEFTEEDLKNGIVLGSDKANRLYVWSVNDWYEKNSGEALVGKEIPQKVKDMVGFLKYE